MQHQYSQTFYLPRMHPRLTWEYIVSLTCCEDVNPIRHTLSAVINTAWKVQVLSIFTIRWAMEGAMEDCRWYFLSLKFIKKVIIFTLFHSTLSAHIIILVVNLVLAVYNIISFAAYRKSEVKSTQMLKKLIEATNSRARYIDNNIKMTQSSKQTIIGDTMA